MTSIIKNAQGDDFTVGGVSFTDYGNTGGGGEPDPLPGSLIQNRRLGNIVDGDVLEALTISTPPNVGRAYVRDDATLGLIIVVDLLEVADATQYTISYDKTVSGVTTTVDVDAAVAAADYRVGFTPARGYMPERDNNGDLKIRPSESTRVIYCSTNGKSASDIETDEALSGGTVDEAWIIAQLDGSSYGETEALALDQALGIATFEALVQSEPYVSHWMLTEGGDTFTDGVQLLPIYGHSMSHPVVLSSYGSGHAKYTSPAKPSLGGNAWGFNFIAAKQETYVQNGLGNVNNFVIDDWRVPRIDDATKGVKGVSLSPGGKPKGIRLAGTRLYLTEIHVPVGGDNDDLWSPTNNNISSGYYSQDTFYPWFEDVFVCQAGVATDYRQDGNSDFPQAPANGNHGCYQQSDVLYSFMSNIMTVSCCQTGIQFRSGATAQDIFVGGSNGGSFFGTAGKMIFDKGNLAGGGYLDGYIQQRGGYWDRWDGSNSIEGTLAVLASGFLNQAKGSVFWDCMIVNSEGGTDLTGPTTIGAAGKVRGGSETASFVPNKGGTGTVFYDDGFVVYNWEPSYNDNANVSGLSTSLLDEATYAAYNDQWKGVTGSTFDDFLTSMRAESRPWERYSDISRFFASKRGVTITPRTTAAEVKWSPPANGRTPGADSRIKRNWSTGDLPGTVANDDVNIPAGRVEWNITPRNTLDALTIGEDVLLEMWGGGLRPTGTLTLGGNANVWMRNECVFEINGYTGANVMSVDMLGGLFKNSGTMTGQIDLTLRGPSEAVLSEAAASYTHKSGRTLTIGGSALVGFDGSGAGSVTIEAGSTVEFGSGVILKLDGLSRDLSGDTATQFMFEPRIGSIVTGSISGATGVVLEEIRLTSQTEGYLALGDCTGTFVDNDVLTAADLTQMQVIDEPSGTFGIVNGTPTYTMGEMRAFRSGDNGFAQPSGTKTVTISGGTLNVNVAGLAETTYDLIEADTLTGTFDTVNVTGGTGSISYPSGKVALTIT